MNRFIRNLLLRSGVKALKNLTLASVDDIPWLTINEANRWAQRHRQIPEWVLPFPDADEEDKVLSNSFRIHGWGVTLPDFERKFLLTHKDSGVTSAWRLDSALPISSD